MSALVCGGASSWTHRMRLIGVRLFSRRCNASSRASNRTKLPTCNVATLGRCRYSEVSHRGTLLLLDENVPKSEPRPNTRTLRNRCSSDGPAAQARGPTTHRVTTPSKAPPPAGNLLPICCHTKRSERQLTPKWRKRHFSSSRRERPLAGGMLHSPRRSAGELGIRAGTRVDA
jgi:hypothetical protein